MAIVKAIQYYISELSEENFEMTQPRYICNFAASLAICAAVCLSMAWGASAAAQPNDTSATRAPAVVTSILPIHSLARALMKDVGTPTLLISGKSSPHFFSLKPSDARSLAQADIVFWVDPALESGLSDAIATLPSRAHIVRLSTVPDITLLPTRSSGIWHPLKRQKQVDALKSAAGTYDPHIWLDIKNARAMAKAMTATLQTVDSARRDIYERNLKDLLTRLDELDGAVQAKLKPVKKMPYIVFHDAYQYFEHAFDLNALGALSISPERKPGAKHIQYLRRYIKENNITCVFFEPQFDSALVEVLIEGTKARAAILDPLGTMHRPDEIGYFGVMDQLAHDLSACLSGGAVAQRE